MNNNLSTLLQLEHNCKKCESLVELFYTIVNETKNLVTHDQAILLTPSLGSNFKVLAVSDMQSIDRTSSYIQDIENIAKDIGKKEESKSIFSVDLQTEFSNNNIIIPSKIIWIPLSIKKGHIEVTYVLMLLKNNMWGKEEIALIEHLASSYSYFLFAMRKEGFFVWIQKNLFNNKYTKYILVLLVVVMFIPVNITVLAPLEVRAKDPFIVTSPLNGAIDKILIESNQNIQKNTLVIKIDDLEFRNTYNISLRALEVAKAKLHTVKQKSFGDNRQKSNLARLETEVELKKSEVEFAKLQLEKTNIFSEKNGLVILNNKSEWLGKPVVIGEKIFQIANPKNVEIKIMLPVSDAIFLEKNSYTKVFFDNDPLNSWEANVSQISFKPELSTKGILSYKIIANFKNINNNDYVPSIGMRGTAKIYSKKVTLFFYLFKRPITTLRQWIGW